MGKKKNKAPEGVPQFKVVVTTPNGRGPLAPYRLAIAVCFALLVAGGRIWSSISEGIADDGALLTAAAAALFAWVITTVISNILGTGEAVQPMPQNERPHGGSSGPTEASMTPPSLQSA